MDIRDAMEEMETIRDIFIDERCVTDKDKEEVTEEFNIAFAAMEKQIPKKPNILTEKTKTDKLACCPTCNSNVDWTYDGFWRKGKRKYCHACGQAIDWSE